MRYQFLMQFRPAWYSLVDDANADVAQQLVYATDSIIESIIFTLILFITQFSSESVIKLSKLST